ncbi:hypothetical protein [Streptomyces sp. NPDC096105]|uniref:hypothetical protein n=1 Tax=Streptomyces sp. NPDC096105 TaxID=3366074 RepID=UPI0038293471
MSDADDDGTAGGGLGATLGKKVGPLPLGVWIAAVVGGIGIAYVVRQRGDDDAEPEPYVPDGTIIGQPNGVGQNGDDDDDRDDLDVTPQTNEQWGRQAIQRMIARGYNPTLVDSAIRKYLAGETLTVTERALIAETLVVMGPPPVPPPPEVPGGTNPDPVDPITPKPPKPDPPQPGPKPPNPTKPLPQPKPPTKPPARVYPKRWKSVVNGKNSSYSTIAAKYKLGISGMELYQYQLSKEAGRSAATRATLRKRGPHLIYAAGTTVLPYPKR